MHKGPRVFKKFDNEPNVNGISLIVCIKNIAYVTVDNFIRQTE